MEWRGWWEIDVRETCTGTAVYNCMRETVFATLSVSMTLYTYISIIKRHELLRCYAYYNS